MKIRLSNKILLSIMTLLILIEIILTYNGGCPNDQPGCWGPRQIHLFWIPFSGTIIILLVIPLTISTLINGVFGTIQYFITKDSEKTINSVILSSILMFFVLTILMLLLLMNMRY